MNDDAAAKACRLQAQTLRAAVTHHLSGWVRRTTLHLAEDYDWRAASLEAAAKFRDPAGLPASEASPSNTGAATAGHPFPGVLGPLPGP